MHRKEHSHRSDRNSRSSSDHSRYSDRRRKRYDRGGDDRRRKRRRREDSTNIVQITGELIEHCGARDLDSVLHSYRPMGICVIREGDTLMSKIKQILVHFGSISSAMAFLEDFEYGSISGAILRALTDSDSRGDVKLSYYRVSGDLKSSDAEWKALKSDWICSVCQYYNVGGDADTNMKESNENVAVKCERADCRSMQSRHCVRIEALSGAPYLYGEIMVDRVKGHRINLKSNAVLAVQGIPGDTTEDVMRRDLQCIGSDTFGVYMLPPSGSGSATQALLQFLSPELAKNALKQALMAEVTISAQPIQMTLIQTPWYRQSQLAASLAKNLLIPKPSDFGIAETFIWDASANCFYDPGSGYYYDIHRRLYYYQNSYWNWDPQSMQYVQVKLPEDEDDDDDQESGNKQDADISMTDEGPNAEDKMSGDGKSEQSGPIKFGFKAPSAAVKDGSTPKNNGQSTTMHGFTAQQTEMLRDLPITLQTKAGKFCNAEKLCCYLCRRKFKTVKDVNDHIKLSPFHLYNLSQWILRKKKEIEAVAAKFYSTIADNGNTNSRRSKDASRNRENAEAGSLQESFLKMMQQHKQSTCDSIGGVRPMMK